MTIRDRWLVQPLSILTVAYAALLPCVLLYPFHFSAPFAYVNNAVDLRANGAAFELPGMLLGAAPAPVLHAALTEGRGLTVAVWFSSQSLRQKELARIFTYSLDPWRRNFALGQDGPNLYVRIKLTGGDRYAHTLLVQAENVVRPGARQLVVLTYDFKALRIFVDGKERAAVNRPGKFLNWDPLSYLAVGNEVTGSRPWLGTVEAAAIFRAALSETDVATLFPTDRILKSGLYAEQLVAYFEFRSDANDKRIADIVTSIPVPPFEKPSYISSESRLAYSFYRGADGSIQLTGSLSLWDLIRNVILFMPLGAIVYRKFAQKNELSVGRVLGLAMVVGGIVSAGFEGLQILIAERTSSIFDVAANSAGALIGAVMMRLGLQAVPRLLS